MLQRLTRPRVMVQGPYSNPLGEKPSYLSIHVEPPAVRPNESFRVHGWLYYESVVPEPFRGIAGATVRIYRNGVFWRTVVTDWQGLYETTGSEPTGGDYNFYSSWDGTAEFAPATSATVMLRVTTIPVATSLTIATDFTTVAVGGKITVTGRLTTLDGKPIGAADVALYANGVFTGWGGRTDPEGYYIIVWVTRKAGEFDINTRFAGTELLEPCTSSSVHVKISGEYLRTHFVGHCEYCPDVTVADIYGKRLEIEQEFEERKIDVRFADVKIKHYPNINRTDIDFIFDVPAEGPIPIAAILVVIAIIVLVIGVAYVVTFLWWTTWVEKEKRFICEQCTPPLEIEGWAAYSAHLERAHPDKYSDIEAGIDNWWEAVAGLPGAVGAIAVIAVVGLGIYVAYRIVKG